MGHIRLGTQPNTVPWRRVVGLIAGDADVAAIAAATAEAATAGLDRARNDHGVDAPFFLLTRIAWAARQPDFAEALRDAGIRVSDNPDAFDLAGGLTEAIDRRLARAGRTDLGEMSQLAAVESLTALLAQEASNLFGTTPAEVRRAARGMSSEKGFATLAHEFYTRFARRFLTYHLGRELGLHVGGNGVFDSPADHNAFIDRLTVHCAEATVVARKYAGDWYSKHNFEGGITPEKTRRFVSHCLKKINNQLLIKGAGDG